MPSLPILPLTTITVGGASVPQAGRGDGVHPQQLEVRRDIQDIQVWDDYILHVSMVLYVCFCVVSAG